MCSVLEKQTNRKLHVGKEAKGNGGGLLEKKKMAKQYGKDVKWLLQIGMSNIHF